jgi:hypothetical protein
MPQTRLTNPYNLSKRSRYTNNNKLKIIFHNLSKIEMKQVEKKIQHASHSEKLQSVGCVVDGPNRFGFLRVRATTIRLWCRYIYVAKLDEKRTKSTHTRYDVRNYLFIHSWMHLTLFPCCFTTKTL